MTSKAKRTGLVVKAMIMYITLNKDKYPDELGFIRVVFFSEQDAFEALWVYVFIYDRVCLGGNKCNSCLDPKRTNRCDILNNTVSSASLRLPGDGHINPRKVLLPDTHVLISCRIHECHKSKYAFT